MTALIARARNSGWPEVLRAALYADAVARLVANDGNFRQSVDSLRQQAELDGEPVMEAIALALGSWNEIDGGDPEAAVADADLGRATVILELAEGLDQCDSYERASAHIAAAVSYGYRRLWELEDEQYQQAENVLLPGEEKFLRAVVLFNQAELQMKWACALRDRRAGGPRTALPVGPPSGPGGSPDRHAPDLADGAVGPGTHVCWPHRGRRFRNRGKDGLRGPGALLRVRRPPETRCSAF